MGIFLRPAPTSKEPEIRATAWAGEPAQCPALIGFPSQQNFPPGLIWSGAGPVPALGSTVEVYINNIGPAVVRAYFHDAGYLGVICAPADLPTWFQRQNPGVTTAHLFGRELEIYTQA